MVFPPTSAYSFCSERTGSQGTKPCAPECVIMISQDNSRVYQFLAQIVIVTNSAATTTLRTDAIATIAALEQMILHIQLNDLHLWSLIINLFHFYLICFYA